MMNEHTVFVRTEAGQQAVRDPQSELPRSVRALLFSIDGRSPADSYVQLLPNFGNVYALLDFLHQAGYIAEKRQRRRRSAAPAGDARSGAPDSRSGGAPSGAFQVTGPPSRALDSRQPDPGDSRFSNTQQPGESSNGTGGAAAGVGGLFRRMFGRQPRMADDAQRFGALSQAHLGSTQQGPLSWPGPASNGLLDSQFHSDPRQPSFSGGSSFYPTTTGITQLPPMDEAAPAGMSLDLMLPDPAAVAADNEEARLQAARDLMADFLHAYLPAIAHDACLSINALQTNEQMLASLPDYSQLVSRTGDMGAAHLAQLHLTLGLA
jgi:hypothetical protein